MRIRTEQQWKQACFNGAFRGLRSQGFERAIFTGLGGSVECLWASAEDRHCAIGWLMPGVRKMERDARHCVGGCAQDAIDRKLLARPLRRFAEAPQGGIFLEELQDCHDDARTPQMVERFLRELAVIHGLTIPDEPVKP